MSKKQTVGVLIVFFLLSVSAYAKDKQPSGQPLSADDIVARMKLQLDLTDQQAQEVKPIIVEHLAQEKQLKLEEKRQLSKVLTGQQLFTWDFINSDKPSKKKQQSLF